MNENFDEIVNNNDETCFQTCLSGLYNISLKMMEPIITAELKCITTVDRSNILLNHWWQNARLITKSPAVFPDLEWGSITCGIPKIASFSTVCKCDMHYYCRKWSFTERNHVLDQEPE